MPRVSYVHDEKIPSGAGREIRAAQYVRMSMEHQRYSIENQRDTIALYAAAHDLTIVRTYADSGKSGLTLEGRDAFQELLDDVQGGLADFSVILVYDVSRWGRFQDPDEAAYDEYLCKRAGISVQYCAELFVNDGSLFSTMIKGWKRVMAAEYSRELSVKVFTGQCRIVGLGFRLGGPAGYGLRRMLVDGNGNPKCELKIGERKNIQTDRVILVPGPPDEVETVLDIYRLFVNKRFREKRIATILNGRGVPTHSGRPWSRDLICEILTKEKYVGTSVFNRTSAKVGTRRRPNPPDQWVRRENAFPAVVPPKLFWAAQRLIEQRRSDYSDQRLLAHLSSLLLEHGRLGKSIIDEAENSPRTGTYRYRFGSLLKAYQLIGYTPTRNFLSSGSRDYRRQIRDTTLADIISAVQAVGCQVEEDLTTHAVRVSGEIAIAVSAFICRRSRYRGPRWKLKFDKGVRADILVAIRLAPGNRQILDYYILPRLDPGWAGAVIRREDNGFDLDRYRFATLDRLSQLVARQSMTRAG